MPYIISLEENSNAGYCVSDFIKILHVNLERAIFSRQITSDLNNSVGQTKQIHWHICLVPHGSELGHSVLRVSPTREMMVMMMMMMMMIT